VGDIGDLRLPARARAGVRLKLRTTAGLNFSDLALDELTLFIRGADELPMRIYEQLVGHAVAVVVRPTTRPVPWQHAVVEDPVQTVGFSNEEALLPYGPRSFQGYRLLQEYFAFPARYLFVRLPGLAEAVRRCTGPELEILVLTDAHDRARDGAVSPENFALFCTPAVNLFPRRADRVHLTEAETEYHVVADRTRPMDFEVHTVREVIGYGSSSELKQTFQPFFAWNDMTTTEEPPAYYTLQRQPRVLSARQRAQGTRTSYVGSEVFMALVDPQEGPYRSSLRQLAIETLCTNRDLPLQLSVGQAHTDFTLESGAPVESTRCLAGPTTPRASYADGDTSWRLISHLSLNYLSLVDASGPQGAAALRDLLELYATTTDVAARRQIEGIQSVNVRRVVRRLPMRGPIAFGRGLEITVDVDEMAFEGGSAFLLGAVLDRHFARYVSINSVTETVLRSQSRGEINRWTANWGTRPTS
ncbi:MAG TPA: type VI secretion system baseplate subunit TssF, partial [Vicinamibacterales bacterium]|nr:type VI secretion system baseplate subunit TssF [Vicinamibacterales bacterium]